MAADAWANGVLIRLSSETCSLEVKEYSSSQHASLPRELTRRHVGSHGVTCHPAELAFPPLPQPKLVLDLPTPEGCKAELT